MLSVWQGIALSFTTDAPGSLLKIQTHSAGLWRWLRFEISNRFPRNKIAHGIMAWKRFILNSFAAEKTGFVFAVFFKKHF